MKQNTILWLVFLGILLFFGAVIILPVLAGSRSPATKTMCLSNMKQLATSMMIYCTDADDRFPPKTWDTELRPYHKNDDLLNCPTIVKAEKKYGYAMHSEVMGKNSAKLAEKTIIFLEVDALAPGVIANLAARSLTRHGEGDNAGSNVSFLDCSARFRTGKEKL